MKYIVSDISQALSVELLEWVFAMSQDALALADPQRRFLALSHGFCDLMGYTPQELVGQHTRVLYGQHTEEFERMGQFLLSNPPPQSSLTTGRWVAQRKDGQFFTLRLDWTPIYNEDGHILANLARVEPLDDSPGHVSKPNLLIPEPTLIGNSAVFRQVLEDAETVAPFEIPVMIIGETGTGKELIARRIHALSRRRRKPFVAVNCAAIPTSLFEAEMFGADRGAYTGADRKRDGLVTRAEGGTLFLDEVGELTLEAQSKLLRFLQSFEYQPVGSPKTERANVRMLCATNRDLGEAVEAGQFRQDLYYRLRVSVLPLPPLRERPDDVGPLTQHFVRAYALFEDMDVPTIAPETLRTLEQHGWPGNIRELENVVRAELPFCKDGTFRLRRMMMTPVKTTPPDTLDFHTHRARLLDRALEASHGKVEGNNGAASHLGVAPSTAREWIKAHGLNPRDYRKPSGV